MMLREDQRIPVWERDFEPDEAAELYAALGAGWKPLDLRSAATRGHWMVGRSRDGGYYAHIRDGAAVLWSGGGPTPSAAILNTLNGA